MDDKKEKYYITTSEMRDAPPKKMVDENTLHSLLVGVMYNELDRAIIMRKLDDVSDILNLVDESLSQMLNVATKGSKPPNFHLSKAAINAISVLYSTKDIESLRVMLCNSKIRGLVELPELSTAIEQDNVPLTNMLISVTGYKYEMEYLTILVTEKLALGHLEWMSKMPGFEEVMKRRGQQMLSNLVYDEVNSHNGSVEQFDSRMEEVIPFMKILMSHVSEEDRVYVQGRLASNDDYFIQKWDDGVEMFLRVLIKEGVVDIEGEDFFAIMDSKGRQSWVSTEERAETDRMVMDMRMKKVSHENKIKMRI